MVLCNGFVVDLGSHFHCMVINWDSCMVRGHRLVVSLGAMVLFASHVQWLLVVHSGCCFRMRS